MVERLLRQPMNLLRQQMRLNQPINRLEQKVHRSLGLKDLSHTNDEPPDNLAELLKDPTLKEELEAFRESFEW